MAITSTVLTNLNTSIFTSDGSNAVTTAYFCNTGERIAYLTVHAVPKTFSPGPTNIIYYQIPIAVKDTYVIDTEKLVLEDGDRIFATIDYNYFAGNTQVIATVSTIGI
jgi:hypothetical protein